MRKILTDLANENLILAILVKFAARIGLFILGVYDEISKNSFSNRKNANGLKKYHNIHKGERCFIVCTGPSLTIEDLEKLKNEKTFSMNSVLKLYDKTNFRPTYYVIEDRLVYGVLEKEINDSYKDKNNLFTTDKINKKFKLNEKWNVFKFAAAYNSYKSWFENKFFCKFSDDVSKCIYSGFNVTASVLQIAVYMGFKEIYLIGADCSYSQHSSHVAEHGVRDLNMDTMVDRIFVAYREAKKYADAHDIKIYNSTRGGMLEIFERKSLGDVLKTNEKKEK